MSLKLFSNVNVLEVGDALTAFEDGYTLYDARYVQKSGDTMTGALFIDGSSDVTQLRVQGKSAQTANLQTWEDTGGTVLTQLDKSGGLRIGTTYGDQTIKLGLANTYPFELAHADLPGAQIFHVEAAKYVTATEDVQYYGANFLFQLGVSGSHVTSGVTGFTETVRNIDTGKVNNATGASYLVQNTGGGTIQDAAGLVAGINNSSGTLQHAYGILINYILNSGTLNDAYGIYLPDINAGDTKNYAIFTNAGDIALMASSSDKIGFHGAAPVARQTVTGSRGGNAALASLLTKLANLGLIIDSTT